MFISYFFCLVLSERLGGEKVERRTLNPKVIGSDLCYGRPIFFSKLFFFIFTKLFLMHIRMKNINTDMNMFRLSDLVFKCSRAVPVYDVTWLLCL